MKAMKPGWVTGWCSLLLVGFLTLFASLAVADDFSDAVDALNEKSFSKKEQSIKALTKIDDDRVIKILRSMLAGELYYRKNDKKVVFAERNDDGYLLTDPISSDVLGQSGRRDVKKISINNKLRGVLKNEIAQIALFNKKASVRLSAVNEMMSDMDDNTNDLLLSAQKKEQDEDVLDLIDTAFMLYRLQSGEMSERIQAAENLSGNIHRDVRVRMRSIATELKDSEHPDDRELLKVINKSLDRIEAKIAVYEFFQKAGFGLGLGSVLVLAAIGLAITFGVMGVINMAHGELIMLGAYTTYFVQLVVPVDYSIIAAIPAAFVVSGLVGIAIERGVIRFMYGRPLDTLLATFGIGLILQQLVRTFVSHKNVPVEAPSWMAGSVELVQFSDISLTVNRIYIAGFTLVLFIGLLFILKKTALGLHIRAVSLNRPMAKAMGVKTEWVDALTFGLGSGVAGIAGVALSQIDNVSPNLGQSYIIDSFMVVVFGGVGNLFGTLVGGTALGETAKFMEPVTGAVLAKILVLIFIIIFIQIRPRGLFPQKGRAAEN